MKIKNIINSIIAASAVLVSVMSCDLELEPTTAIVYDEDKPIFQSVDDVESFYYGVLASYRSLCSGSFDVTLDLMTDYFNATSDYGNNYGPVHRLDASYTSGDEYVESIWASHYSAIKNYNVAIEQVAKIENPELKEIAQELKCLAYYCRASAYLTLTRLFGEVYNPDDASTALSVPLVLKYDQSYVPVRNTVEEVYMQIEEDLDSAAVVISQIPGAIGAESPTADALDALYARYYLDTQKYSKAYSKATNVIERSEAGYVLASTKNEMMNEYSYDSGSEAVLQLFASKSEGAIYKTVYTLVGNDEDEGKYFSPYYLPSKNLLDAYDTGDLRMSTWFTNAKYSLFLKGSYNDGMYTFVKYLGNEDLYSGFVETGAHAPKPIMISELHLIAAEADCMDKGGASVNSKKYLNNVQKARGAVETDGSLDNIKKEWYREMVGNGQLFVCLKRWGDGIPARPYQPEASDYVMKGAAYEEREIEAGSYLFNLPIPSYEIKITPSLGQNDGFGGK